MQKVIIFTLCIVAASILYTCASFFNWKYPAKSLPIAVLIAVGFATVEYCFKVPGYNAVKGIMDPAMIHIIWVALAFITTNIFETVVMKQQISWNTWLTSAAIIVLVVANGVLEMRNGSRK